MSRAPHTPLCDCVPRNRESVLTFDGGGVRGLLSLYILREILRCARDEELERDREASRRQGLEHVEPQDRDLPLACYYFSFMFGTSTGGIIAIMLGRLRMNIEQCIEVYSDFGREVFAKKQPFHFLGQDKYDSAKLKRVIQDVIRRHGGRETDLTLEDTAILGAGNGTDAERYRNRFVGCRVGVIALQNDGNSQVHLFRSYYNNTPPGDRVHLNLNNQFFAKIWEVARATSAAPTYFSPIKVNDHTYLDGGLIANNPAYLAWTEANSLHQIHPSGPCRRGQAEGTGIRFLVSIGTGIRADQKFRSGAGPIPRLKMIFNLAKRGLQKLTDPEETNERLFGAMQRDCYYRFNVDDPTIEKMALDECKMVGKHNISFNDMRIAVDRYVHLPETRARLRELARQLVDHRRSKCRDPSFHGICQPGPLIYRHNNNFYDEEEVQSPVSLYPTNPSSPLQRNVDEMPNTTSLSELEAGAAGFHDTPQHP